MYFLKAGDPSYLDAFEVSQCIKNLSYSTWNLLDCNNKVLLIYILILRKFVGDYFAYDKSFILNKNKIKFIVVAVNNVILYARASF